MEFDAVVLRRHSTRMFLPDKPVPTELLYEALTLAMRAPSNSNVQPWRLFLASGARRERLGAALARMEINSFYAELLPRLTSVELAGTAEHTATIFVGGLKHLPIRYALTG